MKASNVNREWWKENNKKDKNILHKKNRVMRLVKPVNYWGTAVNTQICEIMEIYTLYIDYISVACPEASRHRYTGLGTQAMGPT